MSSFTQPLCIEPATLVDGSIRRNAKGLALWRTTRELVFEVGKLGSGWSVIVPTGFETDLGSIPRGLWWLLPPHDPQLAAAFVVHDCLRERPGFPAFLADSIFLDALFVLKPARWRALVMYLGVRLKALAQGF